MTIVLQLKRLHSVIVFQIYYLYINIGALNQYIWTPVSLYYVNLIKSYIVNIIIDIFT